MADDDVLANIQQLSDEEHELYERHRAGTPLNDEDLRRMHELQVRLDQCWDLLRQRRARREFGDDPARARARDESTVEGYQQ
ncbi:MAG TPA: DUF2630 family protein [Acidimicrobiia bacterium]|nr:DUF2630 family protein [Acidimicrobiia bacterium]